MKKKFISLVLCAAVCLTTGCGSKTNTPASGTSLANQTASTPSGNSSAAGSTTVSNPTVSTPAVSTPSAETGKFVRGKWNGNVFTSDFFGITVNLDDNCVKETDEQLAARNRIDDMSDTTFNNAVENSNANTAIYELFLQYGQKGNLALAYNRYTGTSLDEYVQANANGLKLSSAFKDVKIDTVKIAGKDQACVYTTFISGTTEVKEIMVMYKNGDYFAIVTIGAFSDAELQNMIKTLLG